MLQSWQRRKQIKNTSLAAHFWTDWVQITPWMRIKCCHCASTPLTTAFISTPTVSGLTQGKNYSAHFICTKPQQCAKVASDNLQHSTDWLSFVYVSNWCAPTWALEEPELRPSSFYWESVSGVQLTRLASRYLYRVNSGGCCWRGSRGMSSNLETIRSHDSRPLASSL